MKKILFFFLFGVLTLGRSSQQIFEHSLVINIEVPVRVFKGPAFIDTFSGVKPTQLTGIYLKIFLSIV